MTPPRRILIVVHPYRQDARQLAADVIERLTLAGIEVCVDPLVAESLSDYLTRRPEFHGPGKQSKFLTTGDPRAVSDRATQFLKRRIAFQAA